MDLGLPPEQFSYMSLLETMENGLPSVSLADGSKGTEDVGNSEDICSNDLVGQED